ncbi:AbrB/MazE/SpoVT family DNA-binding domain-containing protein [Bacillus sp. CGMCC 1.60114]|uniref:AbrB/MazE/SpoVT family DNA-binding domain-containing protein n=1 Tax=unclassified Bacillus (in: firmicutes) TaxID=185979 RepID=UPI00362844A7
MVKYTVSSKGQTTIPKSIREYLDIQTGDRVVFKINKENNTVIFEKDEKEKPCPICIGTKVIGIKKLPCFICSETGLVNTEFQNPLTAVNPIKYGISVVIRSQEIHTNSELAFKLIPIVQLQSSKYPKPIMERAQDYYQVKFIEEFAPKSKSDPKKFIIPSDKELEEIMLLLKTDDAKWIVRRWFR